MPTYCLDLTVHNTPGRLRGVGRYAFFLAQALSRLRKRLDSDERIVGLVSARGKTIVTSNLSVDDYEEPLPKERDVAKAGRDYARKHHQQIRKALASNPVDVVHFMEGPRAMTGAFSSVVTCHDLIPLRFPESYLTRFHKEVHRRIKDYLAYHQANRVIAISRSTHKDLTDLLELPPAKAELIHHGVDHDTFQSRPLPGEGADLRMRYRLPERYVLYVGAHDARKRVSLLIKASAAVFSATGVPLVLAGKSANPLDLDPKTRRAFEAAPTGTPRDSAGGIPYAARLGPSVRLTDSVSA